MRKKEYLTSLYGFDGKLVFYIKANTDNLKPFSVHAVGCGQVSDYYTNLGNCSRYLKKVYEMHPESFTMCFSTIDLIPTSGSNYEWFKRFYLN